MVRYSETTVAPGVTQSSGTHACTYTGTKCDLLAAGVARSEWFPAAGERNNRGQVVRFKELTADGRQVRIESPVSGLCTVWVWYTPEECAVNVAREKMQDARDAEMRALQAVPNSAQELRQRVSSVAGSILSCVRIYLRDGIGGYHFDVDALAKFDDAADDLIRAINEGGVVFNPARRARCIAKIRARTVGAAASDAAESDPQFRRFLEQIMEVKGGCDAPR